MSGKFRNKLIWRESLAREHLNSKGQREVETMLGVSFITLARPEEHVVGQRILYSDGFDYGLLVVIRSNHNRGLAVELVGDPSRLGPKVEELRALVEVTRQTVMKSTQKELSSEQISAVLQGPSSWFISRKAHPIRPLQRHAAAASGDVPILERIIENDIDVIVEVRGHTDHLVINVISNDAAGEKFLAIEVLAAHAIPYVVPVRAVGSVASIVCPLADSLRIALAHGLTSTDDQPDAYEIIRRSVGASDGLTQEVWRVLAREAGQGSPLYTAVAGGLR